MRWVVLLALGAVAFHATISSIATQTYNGDPLAYLAMTPIWAVLLVVGTEFKRGNELEIHDRQVDWIVATCLAGLLAMVDGLLQPRLGATAQLVRIDILSLVLFIMIGCILLFGTRSAGRYWATWLFVMACWPLPYRLVGAALGGTPVTYGLLNISLGALATFIAVGGRFATRLAITAAAIGVGAITLALLHLTPQLPTTAIELIPPAIALIVPIVALVRASSHSGTVPLHALSPRSTSAVKRPFAAIVILAVAAGLIGTQITLVPSTLIPSQLPTARTGWSPKPVTPTGWTTSTRTTYSWADQYFGAGSTWERFRYRPTTSSAVGVSTTMVVDVLTSSDAGPLSVYPAITCYKLTVPYLQSSESVSVGHGVTASLFYANTYAAESPTESAWALLTWTWKSGHGTATRYQRVTVLTVDGSANAAGVPFPGAPGANNSVRTTFTDIFRGAASTAGPAPSAATSSRLTRFSSALVSRQTTGNSA
jgi:hypothetical protein